MSSSTPTQRFWDGPIRLFHWTLVVLLPAAWFSHDLRGPWHEWLGYGAAAVVALRVGWGFVGSSPARFTTFVRGPAVVLAYLRTVLAGHPPRYLGHNPLGGWMVVALLATAGLLSASGWLFTTEWLWGYEWLSETHVVLGWVLVGLVALHVAGVVFTSWHQRENLVRAMVDGRKRGPEKGDRTLE